MRVQMYRLWLKAARWAISHRKVSLLRIAWTLFLVLLGHRVSKEVYQRRIKEGCEVCPLFFHPLRTCGHSDTWINQQTGREEPLGCLCLMDLKALLPEATCWLHSVGLEDKWNEH